MINLFKTFRSFRYAFAGVRALFTHENNAKVHLFLALLVIIFGVWLKISSLEWALSALCIGLVWAAEAFNTALEKLCDLTEPNPNEIIKNVKDLSASAVLFVALGAAVVAACIFLPKLLLFFGINLC